MVRGRASARVVNHAGMPGQRSPKRRATTAWRMFSSASTRTGRSTTVKAPHARASMSPCRCSRSDGVRGRTTTIAGGRWSRRSSSITRQPAASRCPGRSSIGIERSMTAMCTRSLRTTRSASVAERAAMQRTPSGESSGGSCAAKLSSCQAPSAMSRLSFEGDGGAEWARFESTGAKGPWQLPCHWTWAHPVPARGFHAASAGLRGRNPACGEGALGNSKWCCQNGGRVPGTPRVLRLDPPQPKMPSP